MSLTLQCNAASSKTQLGWRPSILVGYGITHADQTQTVNLADTPAPGLDNRYVGDSTLYGAVLLGFAFDKTFETAAKNMLGAAGLEVDYLRNNAVNGTVLPMINVSPDFDQLKYVYDIHSFLIQATAKLIKQDILCNVDGYVQAGLGAAINRLSDYREYSPGESTAAPMLSPFGDKDNISPALSAGIGFTYHLRQQTSVSLGYRYFYAGRGRLMKSPIQQTNASITLSPISYQFLLLSLTM
jgi:opacity protein-like surface antigen